MMGLHFDWANPMRRITKTSFPRAKFTRQVLCSFFSAPMCGKSLKHSFITEDIVNSSISRAWTPHAIFLSDRNDPLWECWYNLSNLTNQRVYQELVYQNGSLKKWLQAPPPLLSPVSSRFIFVFALSQFSGLDYLGAWNRLVGQWKLSTRWDFTLTTSTGIVELKSVDVNGKETPNENGKSVNNWVNNFSVSQDCT